MKNFVLAIVLASTLALGCATSDTTAPNPAAPDSVTSVCASMPEAKLLGTVLAQEIIIDWGGPEIPSVYVAITYDYRQPRLFIPAELDAIPVFADGSEVWSVTRFTQRSCVCIDGNTFNTR